MIDFIQSEFLKSAVRPDQYPASAFLELAFVGRSNVGKSSFINTILNRKQIARISTKPGKTRLINFYQIRFRQHDSKKIGFMNFVDLPGYGYAKVSKKEREKWKEMITIFFQQRIQLRGVIILIDIRRNKDEKDEIMIELAKKMEIPFLVVATKADKIGKTRIPISLQKLQKEFDLSGEKIIAFSSKKKFGTDNFKKWLIKSVL